MWPRRKSLSSYMKRRSDCWMWDFWRIFHWNTSVNEWHRKIIFLLFLRRLHIIPLCCCCWKAMKIKTFPKSTKFNLLLVSDFAAFRLSCRLFKEHTHYDLLSEETTLCFVMSMGWLRAKYKKLKYIRVGWL